MQRQEIDILLNTFYIKSKRYRVLLSFDTVIWEKESNANDKTTIPVGDVIAVEQSVCPQSEQRSTLNEPPRHLRATDEGTATITQRSKQVKEYLTIHYAKRVIKSSRDCNRWRRQAVRLYSYDLHIVAHWHSTLQKIVSEQNRLHNVLVFINPFGGQRRGLATYEKYCKPLFKLANIDASCIISQRSNQIHDIMMTHNLDQYDAVCSVGGDGTFAEVVNGLLFRTIKDLDMNSLKPKFIPKPKLPVAVIPAGSTDTVAFSLHGTRDVMTAAIHMVLGQKRGLDICSVENSNGLIRFCASVLSYGYLGDVALQSEKYRWMGTKRYEYTGIRNLLLNASYSAELRIQLSNSSTEVNNSSNTDTEVDQSCVPYQDVDDQQCFVNCHRCTSSSFLANEVYKIQDINHRDQQENTSVTSTTSTTKECNKCKNNSEENIIPIAATATTNNLSNICDNNFLNENDSNTRVIEKRSDFFNNSTYTSETEEVPVADQALWKAVKGGFFMISGANITCACARSPKGMSKYCHLGDGTLDLILIHKTNFFNTIRLIIKMVNKNGDIRDLPFVEVYRTKKFCFRANQNEESWDGSCYPINDEEHSKTSQWNCDGEIVHDLEISMSSHCQLLDVFMRGPYPFQEDAIATTCCPSFCKT